MEPVLRPAFFSPGSVSPNPSNARPMARRMPPANQARIIVEFFALHPRYGLNPKQVFFGIDF